MEYLVGFLKSWLGDPNLASWVFITLVGASVFGIGAASMALAGAVFDPVRGRARALVEVDRSHRKSLWTPVRKAMAPYVMPKKDGAITSVRAQLIHAGFRSESAPTTYYAVKTLFTFGLPALLLLITSLAQVGINNAMISAAIGTLVGAMLPHLWLKRAIKKRKRVLYAGLPDALDLLVVCTEAGYGLKPSIQRVADELQASHPQLAGELALVNAEIRAGVDRIEALRHLADRTNLEDIGGLVSLLSQSLRFGTSIADSLRIYSEEFRDKRTQRAEEAAAKISTKMVFPLVFCMFPAFFLVAIGPAIIGVLDAFK
jgi:tight adherence protein C